MCLFTTLAADYTTERSTAVIIKCHLHLDRNISSDLFTFFKDLLQIFYTSHSIYTIQLAFDVG